MHHIYTEDNTKSIWEMQRQLNLNMQDVVKKEVIKWLDVGIIYLISDSHWVSPTQIIPKKSRLMIVCTDHGDLVPTWFFTRWRVCIDDRKLNAATRKDYFPLPFIDQILERLAGQQYFFFLDRYSGYN